VLDDGMTLYTEAVFQKRTDGQGARRPEELLIATKRYRAKEAL
jgi:hypothetical protein